MTPIEFIKSCSQGCIHSYLAGLRHRHACEDVIVRTTVLDSTFAIFWHSPDAKVHQSRNMGDS